MKPSEPPAPPISPAAARRPKPRLRTLSRPCARVREADIAEKARLDGLRDALRGLTLTPCDETRALALQRIQEYWR